MNIYMLERENLSCVGGPMGTEHTWADWTKPFSSLALAKAFAEKDYKKHDGREEFEWHSTGRGRWCSGDLLSVMYNIEKVGVK